jgi:hypothetical protein
MATGSDLLTLAQRELGKPYVYGANGPETFDCSGLVQYAAAQLGLTLPHRATLQRQLTTPVSSPLPGDLVFYGTPAFSYHVGIYAGNGRMIDAPKPGDAVQIENVWGTPSYGRLNGLSTSIVAQPAAVVAGLFPHASDIVASVRPIIVTALFVSAGIGLVLLGGGQLAGARKFASSALRKVFPA